MTLGHDYTVWLCVFMGDCLYLQSVCVVQPLDGSNHLNPKWTVSGLAAFYWLYIYVCVWCVRGGACGCVYVCCSEFSVLQTTSRWDIGFFLL